MAFSYVHAIETDSRNRNEKSPKTLLIRQGCQSIVFP